MLKIGWGIRVILSIIYLATHCEVLNHFILFVFLLLCIVLVGYVFYSVIMMPFELEITEFSNLMASLMCHRSCYLYSVSSYFPKAALGCPKALLCIE